MRAVKSGDAMELQEYVAARLRALAVSEDGACKICGEKADLFDVLDFAKACEQSPYQKGLSGIPVFYRRCVGCGFIYTDFFDAFTPEQWRRYIYNQEYADADPEYAELRPRRNMIEVEAFLSGRKSNTIGLDYGGGNGQTAALLREKGWAYDTYDPFGHSSMAPDMTGRYNFCSAFEVFEHSPDPTGSLRAILEVCSPGTLVVLISTGITDRAVDPESRLSWWYAAPRNGHISLYSRRSLQILAARHNLAYASVSPGTHVVFRGISAGEVRSQLLRGKMRKTLQRLAGKLIPRESRSPSM